MIFMIPGGANTVNHAWAPQTNAAYLAAHLGVVIGIQNYRRGIFGHLPHPSLGVAEPSVAYTDITLAQKSFFANAAAFGGDPERLCDVGTSAGGAYVQLRHADETTCRSISPAHGSTAAAGRPFIGIAVHRRLAPDQTD